MRNQGAADRISPRASVLALYPYSSGWLGKTPVRVST